MYKINEILKVNTTRRRYIKKFSDWTIALHAAFFDKNKRLRHQISREGEIRRAANQLQESPRGGGEIGDQQQIKTKPNQATNAGRIKKAHG